MVKFVLHMWNVICVGMFSRLTVKSEDVQYMKFDHEGNLYLYEPSAGMSGEPKRVIEFGSDEVVYAGDYNSQTDESDKSGTFDKFQTLSAAKVHHIVPSKKPVIMNVSDGNRRYLIFFQIISIFSLFRLLFCVSVVSILGF